MSLVVTGAAGFIGRHLTTRLVAEGHRVVAIDRRADLPEGAVGLVGDLAAPDDRIEEVLGSAEKVWHLAARSGVRNAGPEAAAGRHLDNVVATRNVLAATPLGIPVIVTSSSSVYGGSLRGGSTKPCREDDRLAPRGGYAASKVEVEQLCSERIRRGGRVSVSRPFTVAGEGQRDDMAIAIWARAALSGRPIRVFGSLQRSRDITDVADVVEGLIRLGDVDDNAVVNLGTGVGRTLGEIVGTVTAAVGTDPEVIIEGASDEEVPATLADTARCLSLLGFVPSTDLPSLIERQVSAIRSGALQVMR